MSPEREWLNARGITDETIQAAGLSWLDGRITIPYRLNDTLLGNQYRWINEKKFNFDVNFSPSLYFPTGYMPKSIDNLAELLENVKETTNGFTARCPAHNDLRNSLYFSVNHNGHYRVHCFAGCTYKDIAKALDLQKDSDTLWVVEGAFDALILHQLGYPVVAVPSASLLDGIKKLVCKNLILALDNDDAGNKACETIANMGTRHKLFRAKYEGKDPNENYLVHGDYIYTIEPLIVGGIKHIKEIHCNGNITNSAVISFDNAMPSWHEGDLIVLFGREKSGKSSWVLETIANNKVPTLIEEYEMVPERVKDWFIRLGGSDEHPLYITTEFKEFQLHDLFARITNAITHHGVKVVVIDHVHFLASGKDNIVNLLANVTQKLKLLAMQYKIVVTILAHETSGEIRDCRLVGGNADQILHLSRLKNAIQIDTRCRYYPSGTYLFNLPKIALEGVKE